MNIKRPKVLALSNPANICLTENDLKRSRKRLQRNNLSSSKTSSRHLQDVQEDEKLLHFVLTKIYDLFMISLDIDYVLHHFNAKNGLFIRIFAFVLQNILINSIYILQFIHINQFIEDREPGLIPKPSKLKTS